MSSVNFESSWKKDVEREGIRRARQEVLAAAEAKGLREAGRREQEQSWMLPDLEKTFSGKEAKKKKRKKEKKEKKQKKSKKEKKKRRQSTSSSNSSEEEEWVEQPSKQPKNDEPSFAVQRDSWMNLDCLATSSGQLRVKEEEKRKKNEKEKEDRPGNNFRELNPYFRDGGSGVPEHRIENSQRIGDGGASWLKRAFKRAQEQAEREGKSIEEIAQVRWGSLEKFQQLLAKAEGKPTNDRHNSHRRSDDGSGKRRRSRSRSPDRRPSSSASSSKSRGGWKTDARREVDRSVAYDRSKPKESDPVPENKTVSDPNETTPQKSIKEEVVILMTEKEMNCLGAKIIKAELMGNTEKAEQLKSKLEAARKVRDDHKAAASDIEAFEETVILTRTDSKGMTRPVETDVSTDRSSGRRKKGKVETHADGERVRYFADDDHYDLKQMFEREKMSTAEDQNGMMSRLAGKAVEKTDDDDYAIDDLFASRAANKRSEEDDLVRDRDKAIGEHQRLTKTLETCRFCFGGSALQKHLMVAVGKTCYICLPPHTSLTEDHCYIVPMSHTKNSTFLDEDVYHEMQSFRKSLCQMYSQDADDRDCVFFESSMGLNHHPHMVVECVPLPREMGDDAPMFFQKAIQESESEWSHNKKLVKLSNEKNIRRSVPKGLPYFHIDFGMQNGFAHVIEDEQEFPRNFAQGN
jgi:hypothetical protein